MPKYKNKKLLLRWRERERERRMHTTDGGDEKNKTGGEYTS